MFDVILKSLDEPDEIRRFEKGKFEVVGEETYVSLHFIGAAKYAK